MSETAYIIKGRSTGKYLAVCETGYFLVNQEKDAQRFCSCHAPEIAGVAAKIFGMGFRVLPAPATRGAGLPGRAPSVLINSADTNPSGRSI